MSPSGLNVHEIGIAQEVRRIIEARSSEFGDARVRAVRLRIGELAGVNADSLRFALGVCSQGTRAEGMAIEITQVPARLKCRKCSKESAFDMGNFKCPECGSSDIDLQGGDELYVESFELDSPD